MNGRLWHQAPRQRQPGGETQGADLFYPFPHVWRKSSWNSIRRCSVWSTLTSSQSQAVFQHKQNYTSLVPSSLPAWPHLILGAAKGGVHFQKWTYQSSRIVDEESVCPCVSVCVRVCVCVSLSSSPGIKEKSILGCFG